MDTFSSYLPFQNPYFIPDLYELTFSSKLHHSPLIKGGALTVLQPSPTSLTPASLRNYCSNSCLTQISVSHIQLFATPWTVAYQAPLSMEFSKQECWSGLPFPSPGDLLHTGLEPGSPALQVGSLPAELPGKPLAQINSCRIRECIMSKPIVKAGPDQPEKRWKIPA